ncbi:acyl carrier protein, partial [Kitasatospora sp. SUK 42]|uniref:acyl carrier protein n=1 Tax=Kitasatospora sp. SUK 42 TaxID=1588882 RepID=UPI00273A3073
MALFDASQFTGEAVLGVSRIDTAALRARGEDVPTVLSALVPPAVRRAETPQQGTSLVDRLAGLAPVERERALTELVRGQVAAVLGHTDSSEVAADRAFQELGFDSLTAVELRNQLNTVTG